MEQPCILIVDDEFRTRRGLTHMLETWAAGKADVMSVEGGEEALDICSRRRVDLLMTDIRMPVMSGLALVKQINSQANKPVVILLSGYSEFAYAQEAIKLGVVNYLLKPVGKQKLIEAVEQGLQIGRERRLAGLAEKVVDRALLDMGMDERQKPSAVRSAMRYVEDNLRRTMTLKDVAEHVHLNASYFSALFKEKTNVTFSEYVTRRRLERAKQLLASTDWPVSAIAEEVGYQTDKYFISLFKAYEGLTPGQYRKELE